MIERPGRPPASREREARPDRVLLDRFVDGRDEEAFEALVRRHGPDVLRICRYRLGESEAEDAFQATFIALVSHAGSVREGDSLGAWLRCVARRVAGRARARAALRRGREGADVDIREFPGPVPTAGDDIQPLLRAEVARLPEKYRRVVELCYWQGLSCEEAAGRLDCPAGTIKWRLSRAREILRGRLDRLGVAVVLLLSWIAASGSASASSVAARARLAGRASRPWGGRLDPSDDLVRRTIDLAARFRDGSLARVPDSRPIPAPRGRWRRRWWFRAGLMMLAAIVIGYITFVIPPVRRLVASSAAFCLPGQTACH